MSCNPVSKLADNCFKCKNEVIERQDVKINAVRGP